jgi:hypothetical protein
MRTTYIVAAGVVVFGLLMFLHIGPVKRWTVYQYDGSKGPQVEWATEFVSYNGKTVPHIKGTFYLTSNVSQGSLVSDFGNVTSVTASDQWISLNLGATELLSNTSLASSLDFSDKINRPRLNFYVSTRNGVFRYVSSVYITSDGSGGMTLGNDATPLTQIWSPRTARLSAGARTYTQHLTPPWYGYLEFGAAMLIPILIGVAIYQRVAT